MFATGAQGQIFLGIPMLLLHLAIFNSCKDLCCWVFYYCFLHSRQQQLIIGNPNILATMQQPSSVVPLKTIFNPVQCVASMDRQTDRQTDRNNCLTPLHTCTYGVTTSKSSVIATVLYLYYLWKTNSYGYMSTKSQKVTIGN